MFSLFLVMSEIKLELILKTISIQNMGIHITCCQFTWIALLIVPFLQCHTQNVLGSHCDTLGITFLIILNKWGIVKHE